MTVAYSGNIKIKTVVNGEEHDIIIKNACYVPEITTNSLSLSQLIVIGNHIDFIDNDCKILIAVADHIDKVYRLNFGKGSQNCFHVITGLHI